MRTALLALGLAAFAVAASPVRGAPLDVRAIALGREAPPVVDGRVEAVWQAAPAVRVTLSEGSQGSVEVRVRALRTDTHLYLLVEWPDRTESLNRALEYVGGGWRPTRGREDRLNIAWEIGDSVPEFRAQGCQVLCHKTEGVMRTGGPTQRIDLWYWMAQRTNPVGCADNWSLGDQPAVVEGHLTGRRPDAPQGGPYTANWADDARRPLFAPRAGVAPGPVLLRKDAVPVGPTAGSRQGARVAREVLSPPSGPRGAIEARGAWASGRWTVELRRALLTGSERDVQLAGSGPFAFALSIHDDAERDEHAQMGREVLLLRLE